jgi:fructokinase
MISSFNESVLIYGEILWDILPNQKLIGGAPCNVSYRLSSLGVENILISKIGNDALGKEMLQEIQAKKIDSKYIAVDSRYPTGTVNVTLNEFGDPSFLINQNTAYDYIELDNQILSFAQVAKIFYYGSLIQRNLKSRDTLYTLLNSASSAIKICDINIRKNCFTEETILNSLRFADILKLNLSEIHILSEVTGIKFLNKYKFIEELFRNFNLRAVIVTLGSEGIIAAEDEDYIFEIPSENVKVCDTIGAGDSFTAGLIYGIINKLTFYDSCSLGNKIAALTVTKKGGMPVFSEQEIKQLLLPI